MVLLILFLISLLKFALNGDTFYSSCFVLIRLLQGPAHVDYLFSVFGIGVYGIITSIQILVNPSYNGYIQEGFYKFELIVMVLSVCSIGIIFKQKVIIYILILFN